MMVARCTVCLLLLLACCGPAIAQQAQRKVVPVSYIQQRVKSSPASEKTIRFDNLTFTAEQALGALVDEGISLSTTKKVVFNNCSAIVLFFNHTNMARLEITRCAIQNLYIANSHFTNRILYSHNTTNLVNIDSSTITNGLFVYSDKDLDFNQLVITNSSFFINPDSYYYLENDIGDPNETSNLKIIGLRIENIYVLNSTFNRSPSGKTFFEIQDVATNSLVINDCVFKSYFLINQSTYNTSFEVTRNQFFEPLDLEANLYPVSRMLFPFQQIQGGKLSVFTFADLSTRYTGQALNLGSDSVASSMYLPALQAAYANLHQAYRNNGDRKSANNCFVELKELETKVLAHDYALDHNPATFFELKVNQLVGYFCDYGTNPAKALRYSIYLVLMFAGLYAVFPSTPDNLQRRRWLPYYQNLIRYLSETVQLPHLYAERIDKRLAGLKAFNQSLDEHTDDMPRLLRWLGRWLYRSSILSYRFLDWVYQKADVLPVTWQHLTRLQRLSVSFRLASYTFLFLFSGLLMRLLNAIALSLNAFVTLGYGEMQARGAARYLTVLEGVCGWLLLSIFSVSLISQLLQ